MFRHCLRFLATDTQSTVYKVLDSQTLLQCIHEDAGETAKYYSIRYFGPGTETKVNHLLWTELKKMGHVDIERDEKLEKPPRWYPVTRYATQAPRVRRYRPQDYDLSFLQNESNTNNDVNQDLAFKLMQAERRKYETTSNNSNSWNTASQREEHQWKGFSETPRRGWGRGRSFPTDNRQSKAIGDQWSKTSHQPQAAWSSMQGWTQQSNDIPSGWSSLDNNQSSWSIPPEPNRENTPVKEL